MLRTLLLTFTACFGGIQSHAQIKSEFYHVNDEKYTATIEDFGNPLKGTAVMIVKTVVPNYGSYVWFFSESEATKPAFLDNSPKDIHAGIYLEDHGGLLSQITFKDFAAGLSQPFFLKSFCQVHDADQDGFPEFYLTYFEESDGLDAKPLKVIVYTRQASNEFSKSKITAWIPFQEEDQYREIRDTNFSTLPKAISLAAETILKDAINEIESLP